MGYSTLGALNSRGSQIFKRRGGGLKAAGLLCLLFLLMLLLLLPLLLLLMLLQVVVGRANRSPSQQAVKNRVSSTLCWYGAWWTSYDPKTLNDQKLQALNNPTPQNATLHPKQP